MTSPVTIARDTDSATGGDAGVLVVTIDHPPVNALSHAVRVGLMAAADMLDQSSDVRAMVLRSTGTVFIGGADIREFGGPRLSPMLNDVCHRLEACTKPIVAAMHGAALGGGFEVALASHYRVAAPSVEVAFPEVLLGLLPGAGGTQRASRLAGAAVALDLMLTGRRMSAAEAASHGLIDVLADDPFAAALAYARAVPFMHPTVTKARNGIALRDRDTQLAAIASTRATLDAQYHNLFSPARIVDAVEAAVTRDFDDGCAIESALFGECLASPQRQALVHVFFGEREVRKSVEAGVSLEAVGAAVREALHHAMERLALRGHASRDISAALLAYGVSPTAMLGAATVDDGPSDVASHFAILGECLSAMADAGRRALDSGLALRPIDVDIASVRHAGFPRYRGGALYAAEHL